MSVEVSVGLGLKGRKRIDPIPDLTPIASPRLVLTGQNLLTSDSDVVGNASLTLSGKTVTPSDSDLNFVTNAALTLSGKTVTVTESEVIPVTNDQTPILLTDQGQVLTDQGQDLSNGSIGKPLTLTGQSISTIDTSPPAQVGIQPVSQVSGIDTATVTNWQADDVIVVWAYNKADGTQPAVPASWQTERVSQSGVNCGVAAWRIASDAIASGSTLDPAAKGTGVTLSPDNLTASGTGASNATIVKSTTSKTTGKVAVSMTVGSTGNDIAIGLSNASFPLDGSTYLGGNTNGFGLWMNDGVIWQNDTNIGSIGTTLTEGDRIDLEFDLGAKTIRARKNAGSWSSPVTFSVTGPYFLTLHVAGGTATVNFRPSNLEATYDTWDAQGSINIGTWAGATTVLALVYRGLDTTDPVGAVGGATGGTGVYWPATTFLDNSGASWGLFLGGVNTGDTSLETPPAGFGNVFRIGATDSADEAVAFDSGGGKTATADMVANVGGTENAYATAVLELRANRGDVVSVTTKQIKLTGSDITTDVPPLTQMSKFDSSSDGQVIQNLDLSGWVPSTQPETSWDGVLKITHKNVTVRNVRIKHSKGRGIYCTNADGLIIDGVEVIRMNPPSGVNQDVDGEQCNITVENTNTYEIKNSTFRDGSTAVQLLNSPNGHVHHFIAYNQRGKYPRGQAVQCDKSPNTEVNNFWVQNDLTNSSPEDNMSFTNGSTGCTVHDGAIYGNNSHTGAGIMFETSSTGGQAYNVETLWQGNGDISNYANGATYTNIRVFYHHYHDYGRGLSASNGLMFGAQTPNTHFVSCKYCQPQDNHENILWDVPNAPNYQITRDDNMTPTPKDTWVIVKHPWNTSNS